MDLMSKKKIAHGLDSDIISNLPDNITDEILVRLPIKEALRTCILSTKWRYKWTTIPELDIDEIFLTNYLPKKNDEFVDFVDKVLLLHNDQIQKFSLSTSSVKDRWVFFLSNKNIKEFKLLTCSAENYVLPSYFFLARQFRTLYLHGCVIEPPPTFTGFTNLKSLHLSESTLGNGVLERLISECPLLESLVLHDSFDHLKICAPNLKYSRLSGYISDISFENTPLLSDLTISMTEKISDQQLELFRRSGTCPLVKLFSSLPNIRSFYMMFQETTEFFAACNIPDRIPFTRRHLSRLSLWVDFESLNQILAIFCLFNSSPNLQELDILVCSGRYSSLTPEWCTSVYDLNEMQRRVGCNMDRLQLFPLREICNLPRASPNAEIKYWGHGFSNLIYSTTFVDEGGFECLISKCPLLENLTFDVTNCLGNLNICSPNLKYLCLIGGTFQDICFENTPLLSDVSMSLYDHITDEMVDEKFLQTETRNVVKVLSSLPSLRKLAVRNCFLKFLSLSEIPEKLPFTCHHLTYLSMELNFEDVNNICVTLCLLNSSPNLRELQIDSPYPYDKPAYNIESFWEERAHIDWNMSGLQVVKITDIQGFELELEFIKLLLAKSPMLEVLSIRSGNLDIQKRKGLKFLKELLTFPRASPKARIKFFERDEK